MKNILIVYCLSLVLGAPFRVSVPAAQLSAAGLDRRGHPAKSESVTNAIPPHAPAPIQPDAPRNAEGHENHEEGHTEAGEGKAAVPAEPPKADSPENLEDEHSNGDKEEVSDTKSVADANAENPVSKPAEVSPPPQGDTADANKSSPASPSTSDPNSPNKDSANDDNEDENKDLKNEDDADKADDGDDSASIDQKNSKVSDLLPEENGEANDSEGQDEAETRTKKPKGKEDDNEDDDDDDDDDGNDDDDDDDDDSEDKNEVETRAKKGSKKPAKEGTSDDDDDDDDGEDDDDDDDDDGDDYDDGDDGDDDEKDESDKIEAAGTPQPALDPVTISGGKPSLSPQVPISNPNPAEASNGDVANAKAPEQNPSLEAA